MSKWDPHRQQIEQEGFTCVPGVFNTAEIAAIIEAIN
jgi:hypothetical protein